MLPGIYTTIVFNAWITITLAGFHPVLEGGGGREASPISIKYTKSKHCINCLEASSYFLTSMPQSPLKLYIVTYTYAHSLVVLPTQNFVAG